MNASYEQVFINYIQDKYDAGESLFEVEFWGHERGDLHHDAGMVGRNNGIGCSSTNIIGDTGNRSSISSATPSARSARRPISSRSSRPATCGATGPSPPFTYNTTTGTKTEQTSNIWVRYCGKFRREYELSQPRSTNYTPINFPLLRYPTSC